MKVSDCCGVPAYSNGDSDTEDIGICPECKEHCEYIEEDGTEPNDKNIIGESVAIPLHREQGEEDSSTAIANKLSAEEELQLLYARFRSAASTPAGEEEAVDDYHQKALRLMQEQSRKHPHGWNEPNQNEKAKFVAGANFGFYELPKLLQAGESSASIAWERWRSIMNPPEKLWAYTKHLPSCNIKNTFEDEGEMLPYTAPLTFTDCSCGLNQLRKQWGADIGQSGEKDGFLESLRSSIQHFKKQGNGELAAGILLAVNRYKQYAALWQAASQEKGGWDQEVLWDEVVAICAINFRFGKAKEELLPKFTISKK